MIAHLSSWEDMHELEGMVDTAAPSRTEPVPLVNHGGLVISLDFELAWGVFDSVGSQGVYKKNLLGAREAVPRLLDLFGEFRIPVTWATVGFLFAGSREEREEFSPLLRPTYLDETRNPYLVRTGEDEKSDPLHYAKSLVGLIASYPLQELASHTFSHYYALEKGQSIEQFSADLHSAQNIARAHGHVLSSLVLPRNQNRPDYLPAIAGAGFTSYRSNQPNFLNHPSQVKPNLVLRGLRLMDSFVSITGSNLLPWAETMEDEHGLVDVRESMFLRPYSVQLKSVEALSQRRLERALLAAAETGSLLHLWWHPHNFGVLLEENLGRLRRLLVLYEELNAQTGFGAFSMAQVAQVSTARPRYGASYRELSEAKGEAAGHNGLLDPS